MSEVETVRVVASDPEAGGFVVINASDFDAEVHQLFDPPKKSRKAKAEGAAEEA